LQHLSVPKAISLMKGDGRARVGATWLADFVAKPVVPSRFRF
jgi:hypothetical protein